MGNFQISDLFLQNQQLWDARAAVHLGSDFYDVAGFKQGKTTLRHIELAELGEVRGLKILHLQCHFGLDTLSLARMGAEVTGVDLSGQAIAQARELAAELSLEARFLQSNVYELPQVLDEQFDMVFTSWGVLAWLPDLKPWASLIARYLRPGGKFYMAEFHPLLNMFEEDWSTIAYPYFNQGVLTFESEESYTDQSATPGHTEHVWHHPLADIFSSLLGEGMHLNFFHEFPYSPYPCFSDMKEIGPEQYVTERYGPNLPYAFSLEMQLSGKNS
ncbi:MAG: class I SAM-dependent methyltransferase [Bacteroidota bacterium]